MFLLFANQVKVFFLIALFGFVLNSCLDRQLEKLINPPFPSDAELISAFESKRQLFHRLVKMSDEDFKVTRIAYDFTWVDGNLNANMRNDRASGFSDERWKDYKSLFNELNLPKGISRRSNGIYLHAYISGIEKGYLYSTEKIETLVDSLDDKEILTEKPFACKKLDGNWYIYMARWK